MKALIVSQNVSPNESNALIVAFFFLVLYVEGNFFYLFRLLKTSDLFPCSPRETETALTRTRRRKLERKRDRHKGTDTEREGEVRWGCLIIVKQCLVETKDHELISYQIYRKITNNYSGILAMLEKMMQSAC